MTKEHIWYRNIAASISLFMLLLAIPRLPYGYYTFLRWVVSATALFSVWAAHECKRKSWVFVMGGIAILFNPIIPVHLSKGAWVAIDFCAAIVFFVSMFHIKPERKPKEEKTSPGTSKQMLGVAYHNKGMYDEAIVEYKKAIEMNPEHSSAYYALGVAYSYGKKMYDEAIVAYRKAIEIDPSSAKAHCYLGVAYHNKGMYDEAIVEYKKAIEISSSFTEAHHGLGTAYYAKREYRLAIKHYDRAIELGSSVSPEVLEFLEQYRVR